MQTGAMTMKSRMTVTEALKERELLKKRITKKIGQLGREAGADGAFAERRSARFDASQTGRKQAQSAVSGNIGHGAVSDGTSAHCGGHLDAALQQIQALILRYDSICSAVARSNGETWLDTSRGYMTVSDGVLIDIADVKKYPPEQVTVITTGSQGEPMSALYRMAFGDHSKISLGERDLVVISASAIPGNEKMVDRIINELLSHGVTVWRNAMLEIHVSGHACQEELKLMHALTKPKYFMPIHGEYKHMIAHKELAEYMGMPASDIFVSEIGKVLEIDEKGARWNGTIPSGKIMVDGSGVGDVGNIVLRDRRHLSQDGLIVVVATVDIDQRVIVSGPDIVSRGFVYVREAEEMMEEVREISRTALDDCLWNGETEWNQMKTSVKDSVSKFLFQRTKRRPMILPVIMNV